MSKRTKIILIFSVFLLIIGIGIFAYAYYQGKINLKAKTTVGTGDTSSNAVIYGGVSSVAQLQQKMAHGAGPNPAGGVYAPYQSPDHLQLLFHTLGIWENQFGTLHDGVVYKDGRVFVGNTLVGTNAISAGRTDFGGTVDVTRMPGYNIYWRPPSISFVPNALSSLVFNNGSVVYAIIKSCGNPVRANSVAQKSSVAIEKIERNVTKGETNWVKSTKANPGNTIEYQINYATSGTNNNVIVYDALGEPTNLMNRQYLDYVSGGTYYPKGLNIKGYIAPREIVFSLGNLPSGSKGHVNFRVKVKANTYNNIKICNSAAIISNQVNSLVSNNVCLTSTKPAPPPAPPAPPKPSPPPPPPTPKPAEITKSKSAINVTQGGVNAETVKAHAGDVIHYTLTTRNIGELPENNYVVKDNIADILQYSDVTSTGGGTVNAGEITYPALDIAAGQTVTKTFEVTIKSEKDWPISGDLVMTNVYGNIINVPVGFIEIVLSKAAFNETQGVDATTTPAKPGDVIKYTLTTKNIGNETKKDFVVTDDISDILTYANVTDVGGGTVASKVISWAKVDIEPDQTIAKTFKVTVKPDSEWPANGDLVMTNVYGNTINVPLQPPTIPVPTGVLGVVANTLTPTGTKILIVILVALLIIVIYIIIRAILAKRRRQ